MIPGFDFEVTAGGSVGPRVGRLTTPHGTIDTPAFMPVGTRGAIKGVTPEQLEEVQAQIVLANAFHLADRPGSHTVHALGGLHDFMGWSRPILTDSGGYQVFSLAELRSITDEGVTFRSPIDGRSLTLTPESTLEIQARLGPDIAMVLDHCPPPEVSRDEAARAQERTLRWARQAIAHRETLEPRNPMAVFGILQGGAHEDLRREGGEALGELPFDGFAVGGVSVGETPELIRQTVEWGTAALPSDRPRYLMGVAGFADFAQAVGCGIDLFDCVLPTRNARNGFLFRRGREPLRIRNKRFKEDTGPIDERCDCATCARYSRGFLHHLRLRGERLYDTVASVHNLRVFLSFLEDMREAIRKGSWGEFLAAEGL